MEGCTCNSLANKVAILVSKKRCLVKDDSILLKKGSKRKNAIIKLKGTIIPNEINSNLYNIYFISESAVKDIPYYN